MKMLHQPRLETSQFDAKLLKIISRRRAFTRKELASFFNAVDNVPFRKKVDFRLRVLRNMGAVHVIYNQTDKRFEVIGYYPEKYLCGTNSDAS